MVRRRHPDRRSRTRRACAGAAVAALAALPTIAGGVAFAPVADAAPKDKTWTFAVIGDIPYGDAQIANFPHVVDQINADPDVELVSHLGDIKSGSSLCTDDYFAMIRTQFDRFADPLVYTPGDNEWTDCHRPNNGGYDPLEREAKVREVFFPKADKTLGQKKRTVNSQARSKLPENVWFEQGNVNLALAAPHIVGSNNSLLPWTGNTEVTPEQGFEFAYRTAGDIKLISDTFKAARKDEARAVVIMTQADMFDPTMATVDPADWIGFRAIVQELVAESTSFGGPVYLFNGDSHVYNYDKPLDVGSKWLGVYGVDAAPNLKRITVDGSTGVDDWLKVTAHTHGEPITWERVPFS